MKKLKLWQADMLLVLLTVWWGFSNVGMNYCLQFIDAFTLNAFRFFLGALIVLPFCYRRIQSYMNIKTVKWGIWIGFWLFVTYACATFGVQNTSITNTGFLCGLAVIITPFINLLLTGHSPASKTKISIILSFIGIALLTLGEGFSINKTTLKGDLLCIGCSIAYAIDIILTDKVLKANPDIENMTEKNKDDFVDPICMGIVSLLAVGVMNLCLSLMLYETEIPHNSMFYLVAIFLAIFCTGLSFVIQPFAQQYTSANRVGIILALEPVFNAIIAILIANEHLDIRQYIGGGLMLLAVLILEIDFKQLFLKS